MSNLFNSLIHSWKARYHYDDSETPSWGISINTQILDKANGLVLGAIGIGTSDGSYTYVVEEALCWLEHCLKFSYEGTLLAIRDVEFRKQDISKEDKRLYIHRAYQETAKDLSIILGLMGSVSDVDHVCELALLNIIALLEGKYDAQSANVFTPDGWKIEAEWITIQTKDNLKKMVQPCFERVRKHYQELTKTR